MVEDLSVPPLVAADLPDRGRCPNPSPIDPDHDSTQIDAALRYEQWVDPEPGLDRKLQSATTTTTRGAGL